MAHQNTNIPGPAEEPDLHHRHHEGSFAAELMFMYPMLYFRQQLG